MPPPPNKTHKVAKAVFLDRDGTIIKDKAYLNKASEVEYLPNAMEGLQLWSQAGFLLIVATNQSGVAQGLIQLEQLEAIHGRMRCDCASQGVDIVHFYYAPYLADSGHPCRKPGAGMLLQAALDFQLDLKKSWMIGDRQTDVQAGIAAGTQTVFITGTSPLPDKYQPTYVADHLKEAAEKTLSLHTC